MTVGWRDKTSFEFDGMPKGACVAVSSVGTQKRKEAKQAFIAGWNEMLERLEPKTVLFYGNVPKECTANIVKIKAFQEKFTEVNVGGR